LLLLLLLRGWGSNNSVDFFSRAWIKFIIEFVVVVVVFIFLDSSLRSCSRCRWIRKSSPGSTRLN
jgi:hypothetical protein